MNTAVDSDILTQGAQALLTRLTGAPDAMLVRIDIGSEPPTYRLRENGTEGSIDVPPESITRLIELGLVNETPISTVRARLVGATAFYQYRASAVGLLLQNADEYERHLWLMEHYYYWQELRDAKKAAEEAQAELHLKHQRHLNSLRQSFVARIAKDNYQ